MSVKIGVAILEPSHLSLSLSLIPGGEKERGGERSRALFTLGVLWLSSAWCECKEMESPAYFAQNRQKNMSPPRESGIKDKMMLTKLIVQSFGG